MSTNELYPKDQIEEYSRIHSTPASKTADELEAYTRAQVPGSQMLVGPLGASLLKTLVRAARAKRILEVGCYTGYSALAMAEALPDNGELISMDVNPETSAIARKFWDQSPHGKKIQLILGPAVESIPKLNGKFDFVFIDADKGNYVRYFELCWPLLPSGGVMAVDNCLWDGRVLKPETADEQTKAIMRFNQLIKSRSDLTACLVPIRDGIFVITKN